MPLLKRAFLLVAAFAVAPVTWAETCKYVDADGHVIYSNTPNNPPKGAKKVRCFEDPVAKPAPGPANSDAPQAGGKPRPGAARGDFPKVDGDTQRKRDDERRKILEKELADEQEALDKASAVLAEQESVRTGEERNYQKFLDRVQPFRDTVTTHERNIEAIRREIANLK